MRNYYALAFNNEMATMDTAEKIKQWRTATVHVFRTKAERDSFVSESHLNYECSAKYAKRCGYTK